MFKTNSKISLILYCLSALFIAGCGLLGGGSSKKNPKGQLVGTLDREGFEMSAQYGMVGLLYKYQIQLY